MTGRVAAVGLLTGWGDGVAALPADAAVAAAGRAVVAVPTPRFDGDRFRRATRECLLGVAAVEAMLRDGRLDRAAIRGPRTALLFATAAAYGAANQGFIVAGAARSVVAGAASPDSAVGGLAREARGSAMPAQSGGALYFPYTAPSSVPGEVAIEFGLTGAYVILIGGPVATVDALWQAGRMLAAGECDRALVLAVETFAECEALWRRARWTLPGPLVEAAACALLVAEAGSSATPAAGADLAAVAERRAGRTLACAPLVALALARAGGGGPTAVTGAWRGRLARIELETAGP